MLTIIVTIRNTQSQVQLSHATISARPKTVFSDLWQVALLFIITASDGSVAHEPVWRSWFAAAEGLVPINITSASGRGGRGYVPSLSRCARMLVSSSDPDTPVATRGTSQKSSV